MHVLGAPLNKLLIKKEKWNWTEQYQETFLKIKDMLTSELFLAHFDLNTELVLTSDTKKKTVGIGSVRLHKSKLEGIKAVAHAIRGLISIEKISQLEKEGLELGNFINISIVDDFLLWTDHRLLISILGSKKGILALTANRLHL